MEGFDGCDCTVEGRHWDPVVDDLEESPRTGSFFDLFDYRRTVVIGVDVGEIDGGDRGKGDGGVEVGESFRWVDEEFWDGGYAGVGQTFDPHFG